MKTPTPREIVTQWFERVWQQRSKEAIHEMMPENAVAHQAGGTAVKGPAEFSRFHDQILVAFPDQNFQILRVVGDDTQACLHWEVSGTHTGMFGALPATQKKVRFNGMSFVTVADGRITEAWDCWDVGSLMAELSSTSV